MKRVWALSRHWKLCKHDQRRSITGCGVHLQARNARNQWVLICANPWCPDRWLWTQGPLWCRRPSSVFMQHLPQTRIHNTRLNNSQHSRPSLLNPAQPCWHNTVQHPLSPQHNSLAASSSPSLVPVPRAPHCGRARSHLWSTFQTSPSPISPV